MLRMIHIKLLSIKGIVDTWDVPGHDWEKATCEFQDLMVACCLLDGCKGYSTGKVAFSFMGKIDEEVYVSQPPGFLDPKYPQKVYKVVKALYGLHQAPEHDSEAFVKDGEAGNVDVILLGSQSVSFDWNPTQIVTMLEQILKKSQTGGCQFLAGRTSFLGIIKKESIVATSTQKQKYVAAASCLWASFSGFKITNVRYGVQLMNNKYLQ
ncbi:putative ribonuclease H-like domain-containing protein [Tanacetum coccineum]